MYGQDGFEPPLRGRSTPRGTIVRNAYASPVEANAREIARMNREHDDTPGKTVRTYTRMVRVAGVQFPLFIVVTEHPQEPR